MSELKYRPEIDGLRAIAVLAVVLFHAKIGPLSGGYVGVDIFFVISGFLITSIVSREIAHRSFSIANFYERRIRRIFPALFVVILASFVIGWFVLTPRDYRDFAKSAINAAIFVSNIGFNRTAGYFAPAAETQPLLHTWSLSVEEQFYVVAPLALIGLSLLSTRLRTAVVIVLGLASLAWADWGVRHEWSSAFYLVQSRAWELMIGVALALGLVPAATSRTVAEVAGLVGLSMIAAAIFLFTPETPFPGISAFLPCVGAALVIHAASSPSTLVQRLLSTPPLVGIGKISYSLYLWHWPLLAFAAYEWGDSFGQSERLLLIALAIALSILSWRFVEQPARARSSNLSQRRVFAAGAASIVACIVAAQAVMHTNGALQRLSPEAQAFAEQLPIKLRSETYCLDRAVGRDGQSSCRIGADAPNATFVLWGDSHAGALVPAVTDVARSLGRSGLLVQTNGTPPILDLGSLQHHSFGSNLTPDASVLAAIAEPNVTDVIIHARWALYVEGTRSPGEKSASLPRFDTTSMQANRAKFARLLRHTVETITEMGRRVILVASVPELPYDLPTAVIKDMMQKRKNDYTQSRSSFDLRQTVVRQAMSEMAALPNVKLIEPETKLCGADGCKTMLNGSLLYFDDDHLSAAGASQLSSLLQDALAAPR